MVRRLFVIAVLVTACVVGGMSAASGGIPVPVAADDGGVYPEFARPPVPLDVGGAEATPVLPELFCAPLCCCPGSSSPLCRCCGGCEVNALVPPCDPGFIEGTLPGRTGVFCGQVAP